MNKKVMKVLFLNYEYPPIGGGASIATEALLKQWTQEGTIEVHLVTSGVGERNEKTNIGGRVFVHRVSIGKDQTRLHSQSLRDIFWYTWRAWWYARCLVRQAKKEQPFDVTLAFFTIPCGFLAYFINVLYRVPYVVSLRGADVPGFSEKYDTFFLFAKPLVRFLWHRAEAVIPNSVGITELAKQTDALQEMQIIENGVDTKVFQPREIKSFERIVFLSTSRLTLRKGIHHLIEAFAEAVKKSSTPIELQLIGEGEQKSFLEARVKELGIESQVKFLGRIEHERLPEFYQKAHVFVLPSKNEGMSNSALEALASGLPLVVSGTGGMQELVTDSVNGYFIDPENIQSFGDTLARMATDQSQLLMMGQESRRRAELRGWDKVALRFQRVLTQVIS